MGHLEIPCSVLFFIFSRQSWHTKWPQTIITYYPRGKCIFIYFVDLQFITHPQVVVCLADGTRLVGGILLQMLQILEASVKSREVKLRFLQVNLIELQLLVQLAGQDAVVRLFVRVVGQKDAHFAHLQFVKGLDHVLDLDPVFDLELYDTL